MSNPTIFFAPGNIGTFDHLSGATGVDLDYTSFLPSLAEPTAENWKDCYVVYHEFAHFYQFSTTTYGLLNRALGLGQVIFLHDYLCELKGTASGCRLPLVAGGEGLSFDPAGPRREVPLYLIYHLEELRRRIFGREPFSEDFVSAAGQESLPLDVLSSVLGLPRIGFARMPKPFYYTGLEPYSATDILESHAHALASLWLLNAIEASQNPPLLEEVARSCREWSVGPYQEFLKIEMNGDFRWSLWIYCALCDIALNPFIFDRINGADDVRLMLTDQNWNPTYRLWNLMKKVSTVEKRIIIDQSTGPHWKREFLDLLKNRLSIDDEFTYPFNAESPLISRLKEMASSLNEKCDALRPIWLNWLDSIGTFEQAAKARQVDPLLLTSGVGGELPILLNIFGRPSVNYITRGERRLYTRGQIGLVAMGLKSEYDIWSDIGATLTGEQNDEARCLAMFDSISKLLYLCKDELDGVDGRNGFPRGSVDDFLSLYGLSRSSFLD